MAAEMPVIGHCLGEQLMARAEPGFLRLQRECGTVQSGAEMLAQAVAALPAQRALAASLYRRWRDDVRR